MSGSHHPRGAIEHRAEVIRPPQLGFAGRQPHPHRQLKRPLRGYCGIHCCPRRRECRAHAIAGVLEHETAVCLDRRAQHLIMGGQRQPHRLRVGLPPTSRTFHIGEQKGHHPRRGSHRHDIASAHFMCPSKPSVFAMSR